MRNLSIPYTKDNRVLDLLTPSHLQYIKEIYMPLPYDIMASGRVYSNEESEAYKRIYTEQIEKAVSMDLTVNLLATKPILDLDKGINDMSKCVRELERLTQYGANKVTIGSFVFLKMHGEYISNLGYDIEISVLMNIDCIEKIDQLMLLCPYISSICVYNNFLQQVDELEYIKSKYPNLKLKVLVNHLCLAKCLTHIEHHNLYSNKICDIINTEDANEWRLYSNSKQLFANCKSCVFISSMKEINPLKESVFVRPEDLHHYDHVIDLYKLSGRENEAESVIKSIEAYSNREYVGDITDIVDRPYKANIALNNSKFPAEYGSVKSACYHKCYKCNYCDTVYESVKEPVTRQGNPLT